MNELDVAQWAAPAVQALISAMTGDLWTSARDRFARILARRPSSADELSEDLEESRRTLLDAEGSDQVRGEVSAEWIVRFRRALTRDPSLLDSLRELIDEFGEQEHVDSAGIVQHVQASSGGIVFNQGSGVQKNEVQREPR